MKLLEAVREGERMGNRLNKWHLVARDTGVGPVTTGCGRTIDRSVAFSQLRDTVESEVGNPRVRKCVRCWA